ncbi:MAG: general stress protein [Planctomycetaceae bacterium]|nr:general stress protein [Planctomycetaceae bacterium]
MDLTRTAFGTWSGGRYMHFGEKLEEGRFLDLIDRAYDKGVRSFMTADVYGLGGADEMLGEALTGKPRESYCLVGAVGHDFYNGQREGARGFPRFTDATLRGPEGYADYLREATEKSLARCKADKFDLLLLHNPDITGYTSDAVWDGMAGLKESGLADRIGVAPGPANGFTLDLILCLERFGSRMDWAMVILNPLEPWPGGLCLPAAVQNGVKVITRVVDHGGLFHDDVRPGHAFAEGDHRVYRPSGWVEAGNEKMGRMREVAERHGMTMLQLACLWNLAHEGVESVIPTLIQEAGADAKAIESKLDELAALPARPLDAIDRDSISGIGNNKGCMDLKGANPNFDGDEPLPDRWGLTPEHKEAGERWGIEPARDLVCTM